MKKSEPVLVAMSILAALQFLFAGAVASTLIMSLPGVAMVCAFGMLGVAAAQTGIQFYVRGQVTPNDAVVEAVTSTGTVVAGEANELPTGSTIRQLGDPV